MKTKLLGLIACMALLGASQAGATSITYDVSDTAESGSPNPISYSGTITTDGHTGILGSGDILSWNITITGYTKTYILQPGPGEFVQFDGTSELSATLTTLSWNTSSNPASTFPADFLIEYHSGFDKAFVLYQQSSPDDVSVLTIDAEDAAGGLEHNRDLVTSATLGTAAATTTPLPATLPLFASGLGALGLLGWRRKRKNVAAALAAA